MKLVIGGAWQGKTDAACSYFNLNKSEIADGRSCEFEEIYRVSGICHFHEYVKRLLMENVSVNNFADKLYQKNPDVCIISNEIGYGLVPMDAFEREWREQTGRVCCELAGKADVVLRVTAGIPMVIKG